MAHYPPHPPRKPTRLYRETHHRLIVEQDRPCIICGVRHSTLHDPAENRWGARQVETHHHIIEWALAGAIDLDRFNARIVPRLLERHGDHATYGHDFSQEEMEHRIDGLEHQMWVLCDVHHRSPLVGIHAVTHPIWGCRTCSRATSTRPASTRRWPVRRREGAARWTLALCLLLCLFGIGAAERDQTPHTPPVGCVAVDPQDEPPGLDYDSHNCPGVP